MQSHKVGFPRCCHGSAFQPELYCWLLQQQKEKLPYCRQYGKRQLSFPIKSSACARCGFLREWVQAPSSRPALLSGHISPPVLAHWFVRLQPRSAFPWMTLNSFLFPVCSNQPLQWANLFCIRTLIRRDHFPLLHFDNIVPLFSACLLATQSS